MFDKSNLYEYNLPTNEDYRLPVTDVNGVRPQLNLETKESKKQRGQNPLILYYD
jgi:hypothetical protein